MRILLWHGYLLGGTGSNVYTRALAREWSRAGHDVTVVCQERHPERYDLGGARVVVPELPGGLLPVFVLDRYEGLEARLLAGLHAGGARARTSRRTRPRCASSLPADLVFANHVLLGGAGRRGERAARSRVKAHGSELEYSMRGRPELARWGAESLAARRASSSSAPSTSAHVLEDVVGHVDRVHEVPPGVDVDEFRPEPRERRRSPALLDEARARSAEPGQRATSGYPDEGNAERFAALLRERASRRSSTSGS